MDSTRRNGLQIRRGGPTQKGLMMGRALRAEKERERGGAHSDAKPSKNNSSDLAAGSGPIGQSSTTHFHRPLL